ncbi:MAG: hypothetical protein PHX52_00980 [Candidatus Pacebacteria bacterium]|nr:hypothetical protein [Candidatus Paceibacterota bacterium]MDD3919138.1 hypothetical protein [Candidatus Paceibacterota bacterium]
MEFIAMEELEIPNNLKEGSMFELRGKKGIISRIIRNKNVIFVKFENNDFVCELVYNFIIKNGYMQIISKLPARIFSINYGPSSEGFQQHKIVSFETENGQIRGSLTKVLGKRFELMVGPKIYCGDYNSGRKNGNMWLKT